MVQEEFQRSERRPAFPLPPPLDFPETGLSAERVLSEVSDMMQLNPSDAAHDFTASYVGPPHPIAQRIPELVAGTFFTEWARELQPAAFQMEKEATRMMASLLGRPEAAGFITSGGTESNMSALRLARNLADISDPEFVMPESGHYSFRIAADVLGIRLKEARLREDFSPDMDHVESLITDKTVALVCSIPDGLFGQLDPVAEFSKLAEERGIYLHVDGAFGGFILPFMRELGHEVAPFDFSLPGVSSMMTDGHKLGMLPVATGFFLVRDEEMLQAIATENTVIHNLTATKNGDRAATAWATMRHLGRRGLPRGGPTCPGAQGPHGRRHRADRGSAPGGETTSHRRQLHFRCLRHGRSDAKSDFPRVGNVLPRHAGHPVHPAIDPPHSQDGTCGGLPSGAGGIRRGHSDLTQFSGRNHR